MKVEEVRRFLNGEVVGQSSDGLFFEGRVRLEGGRAVVVDIESGRQHPIDAGKIRWLVKAERYC